jgi:L-asparaginase/Glu-tRNA(Gln) amidotransferase subunit D
MASGQVVLVTTEGLSGGPPMRTVYYVAEEDPAKAEAIIAKFMAPNERLKLMGCSQRPLLKP